MATNNNENQDASASDPVSNTLYPMEDPYFLHSSEQPGSLLVGEKLAAINYNDYSRAMFNALAAKNKLGFLNGAIRETAETDPKRGAWVRNNIMILSWIQQSVEYDRKDTQQREDTQQSLVTENSTKYQQKGSKSKGARRTP
ncbi:unnamed protein product [Linum trigynum]|uniref:Retrotransposon Copia-like N-terminal domain-containing protein n=1 Tax=Linum trigynum TaxID=586398 RepID=A0AAV2CCV6_9ROSI